MSHLPQAVMSMQAAAWLICHGVASNMVRLARKRRSSPDGTTTTATYGHEHAHLIIRLNVQTKIMDIIPMPQGWLLVLENSCRTCSKLPRVLSMPMKSYGPRSNESP